MSSEFKKLACRQIAFEVNAYFPDMSVCQLLKLHGTLPRDGVVVGSAGSTNRSRRTLAERLQSEIDDLAASSSSSSSSSSPFSSFSARENFTVSCDECTSTIRSCKAGEVLKAYTIIWASSTIKVTVAPKVKHTLHGSLDGTHEHVANGVTTPQKAEALELHCSSLHIVNNDVVQRRRPGSFALQSIFQPRYPFLLECYPRHMMHMALVMYAMWHLPEAAFITNSAHHTTAATTTDLERCLLPWCDDDAVLVLGLGGNVIGHCLDHVLPRAVRVDTVEIEPAILQTCIEQGQVPALTEHTRCRSTAAQNGETRKRQRDGDSPSASSKAGKKEDVYRYWSAESTAPTPDQEGTRGRRTKVSNAAFTTKTESHTPSARGAQYRFFVEDAYQFLRDPSHAAGDNTTTTATSPKPRTDYNLIFLDCYDPDREKMMYDEGLVSLCHKRLRPGGCLLVNAHTLPKRANLEGAFLFHGFATVQALRVAGCDQCIVACIRADDADDGDVDDAATGSCGTRSTREQRAKSALEAKQQRFTRASAQHVAGLVNKMLLERWHAQRASRDVDPQRPSRRRTDTTADDSRLVDVPFLLNETWLSMSSIIARMELDEKPQSTQHSHGRQGQDTLRIRQSDCRVWGHNT